MWIDDIVLKQCHEQLFCKIWIPDRQSIVVGNSNDPQTECNLEACKRDEVDILKRYGGGGAVVLYPGCLIISFGAWVAHPYQNDLYFQKINQAIGLVLGQQWPCFKAIQQKGLSDLCVNEKKFAGTSLFRSRNFLLYQASLICELDVSMIERYLPFPSKAPEYRQNRSHRDFLFGLSEVEPQASTIQVEKIFKKNFEGILRELLGDELITPIDDQFKNLMQRANSTEDLSS